MQIVTFILSQAWLLLRYLHFAEIRKTTVNKPDTGQATPAWNTGSPHHMQQSAQSSGQQQQQQQPQQQQQQSGPPLIDFNLNTPSPRDLGNDLQVSHTDTHVDTDVDYL